MFGDSGVSRDSGPFERSRVMFEEITSQLEGERLGGVAHGDLEEFLTGTGRDLLRMLLQDHLDLRAEREKRVPGGVAGADGVVRTRAEPGRSRQLVSVFGVVRVSRIAYRAPGFANVCPADEVLNLPVDAYSHGVRRLAVIESTGGSFAGAGEAIERATGVTVGTRQIRSLVVGAAVDAQEFYATRRPRQVDPSDVLVLTFDGKGVVMRPDSLREQTAKAAAQKGKQKLSTRLSPGEKNGRKRMAELACVHDAAPAVRTVDDVFAHPGHPRGTNRGPQAVNKWLTASLSRDIPDMIGAGFAEADRRDPAHERAWVALVDGNATQIAAITAEAERRGMKVPIIIDIVHVLEYLWSAAWSFFDKGDPDAEEWVTKQARNMLEGKALQVAAGIRRRATRYGFTGAERKNADAAAAYLTTHAAYLDYRSALANGWPIATGVIEGACRHLIKDRMDITGARWGLTGAEAILTLRAIHTTGDLPDYWQYHLTQEHHRNYNQPTERAA